MFKAIRREAHTGLPGLSPTAEPVLRHGFSYPVEARMLHSLQLGQRTQPSKLQRAAEIPGAYSVSGPLLSMKAAGRPRRRSFQGVQVPAGPGPVCTQRLSFCPGPACIQFRLAFVHLWYHWVSCILVLNAAACTISEGGRQESYSDNSAGTWALAGVIGCTLPTHPTPSCGVGSDIGCGSASLLCQAKKEAA